MTRLRATTGREGWVCRCAPASPCPESDRELVGSHEATFRVNVRWVTPLGEDTASMS